LDRSITSRQASNAPLVARLRDSEPTPSDKPLIEAFITHLLGRGRHARESFVDMAASAMDASLRAVTASEYRDLLAEVLLEKALADPAIHARLSMLTMPQRQQFLTIVRAQVKAAADSGALAEMGQRIFTELTLGSLTCRRWRRPTRPRPLAGTASHDSS